MNSLPKIFIFVGRSGSGKGTQIELLKGLISEKYNQKVHHVEMGDILRNFFEEHGYVQDLAKEVTNQHGNFQPDFLVDALFVSRVVRLIEENSIIFFDGYPRNLHQLSVVKSISDYLGYDSPVVIDLDISDESAKNRMKNRSRIDDHDEAIKNRLEAYTNLVLPMIEEVKKNTYFKYIKINGEDSVENIYKNIIETLGL